MRTRSESTLNIIWTILSRIAIIVAVGWFIWKVRSVLITVILSAMLAYMLLPAVEFLSSRRFLSNKHLRRLIATVLVFMVFIGVVAAAVNLMITPFKVEFDNFQGQWHTYSTKINDDYNNVMAWCQKNLPEDFQNALGIGNQDSDTAVRKPPSDLIQNFATKLFASTIGWFKSIFELILIPVLAFYFVLDSRSLKREFIALMPRSRFRETMRISRQVSSILQNYVIGQLILCLIAAVLTGIVLSILHVKYALVLAVFAGITRAIPIIGPFVSGIPICIVGATQSMTIGVALVIFVIIMHFAESKFIMPIVIGERMKLHPAVILIVLLIGSELFGLIGMFLAAPMAAVIRELISFYVIRPRNGKNGGKPTKMQANQPKLVGSERS